MNKLYIDNEDICIKKYFEDIDNNGLLSIDEEIELAKRIKSGDEEAIDILVNKNLKFVVSIAKNYQNLGLPLIDLINEGNFGLIKAAKKFDHTKGFKFISYAVWWIKQSIMYSLSENARMIRLPVNQINKIKKLKSESLNNDIIENDLKCLSYNNYINEDDENNEFLDYITDDSFIESSFDYDDTLIKKIDNLLNILTIREKNIIKYYYGLDDNIEPMTLDAIGEKYFLTKERVRQIKYKAIKKLRYHIHDYIKV